MIKSWNHDNVSTAMRDGVWATQEKNEQLLTNAFHTSRHVVLLFSVNKSTAFQGYVSLLLVLVTIEPFVSSSGGFCRVHLSETPTDPHRP